MTDPFTIDKAEIIPEDGLISNLNELIDKYDDYINTNPVSLAWSVIAKKRPWLEPDYRKRGK